MNSKKRSSDREVQEKAKVIRLNKYRTARLRKPEGASSRKYIGRHWISAFSAALLTAGLVWLLVTGVIDRNAWEYYVLMGLLVGAAAFGIIQKHRSNGGGENSAICIQCHRKVSVRSGKCPECGCKLPRRV